MRRDCGYHDRWMWLLKWAKDRALTNFANHGFLCSYRKILPDQLIRGLSFPDIQNHVDRFQKDLIPILTKISEHLSIRHETARTNTHDESPFQHVIKHRYLRSNCRGMRVRHVDGSGTENNFSGFVRETRQEHRAGRDVF